MFLLFFLDAFEFGTSPNIAFAGPFTIEGGTGTGNGGAASSPAAPASPGSNGSPAAGGATPAAPSSPSTTGTNGAVTSHSASAGTITQVCPKVMFGLAAFAAYQFF